MLPNGAAGPDPRRRGCTAWTDLTVRSRLQVHKQEWSWRPQTFWARKRRLGWLLNCLAWTRLRKSSSGCSRPYRPVLW